MDLILQFLNIQFILFALGIAMVIFVIRTTIEYIAADLHKEMALIWTNLILPILPIILGAIFSYFIKDFSVPDGLTSSGGRILFGAVAGGLSTVMFQVIKGLLTAKITTTVNTYAPPPYPTAPQQAPVYTPPPVQYIPPQNQSFGSPGSKSA